MTKAGQIVQNRVGFSGINAEPGAGHDRVLPSQSGRFHMTSVMASLCMSNIFWLTGRRGTVVFWVIMSVLQLAHAVSGPVVLE